MSMDEGTLKTPIPKCRLTGHSCLGWCSNLVGSESGQRLRNRLYVYFGKRGGGGQREVRGATLHKRGRKYQHV